MAKQMVTVTVYGYADDWGNLEVISREAFNQLVRERAEELFQDHFEFEDWLEENFTTLELWDLTDLKKTEVKSEFKHYCLAEAEKELNEDWEEFEITTEVEVKCDCDKD